jgi:hypothetical protein
MTSPPGIWLIYLAIAYYIYQWRGKTAAGRR